MVSTPFTIVATLLLLFHAAGGLHGVLQMVTPIACAFCIAKISSLLELVSGLIRLRSIDRPAPSVVGPEQLLLRAVHVPQIVPGTGRPKSGNRLLQTPPN